MTKQIFYMGRATRSEHKGLIRMELLTFLFHKVKKDLVILFITGGLFMSIVATSLTTILQPVLEKDGLNGIVHLSRPPRDVRASVLRNEIILWGSGGVMLICFGIAILLSSKVTTERKSGVLTPQLKER